MNIVSKYFLVLGKPKPDSFFLPKIVKNVPLFSEQASYGYCVKRFKLCLSRIGVDPTGFGEHSDRTGGLSAAANVGCTLSDLQTHGRWKSDATPKLYLKN